MKSRFAALVGAVVSCLGAVAAERPNVVLIFADDMGVGDVGFLGNKDILTPNIDALAGAGVHFTQGYVAASVCGPSRAGLLTGIYQQRFGCGENTPEGPPDTENRFAGAGLPVDQPMISELLKKQGYRTGAVGKWHMGLDRPFRPLQRGYDYYYGFLNGAHVYTGWGDEFGKNHGQWPLWRNDDTLPARKDVYLTDLFSDEAVAFIQREAPKEEPFFLYLAYNTPHGPWQVPQRYIDRCEMLDAGDERKFFAGMVLAMDDGVGRVRAAIEAAGETGNTLVIFLTDNGTPQGHGLSRKSRERILHPSVTHSKGIASMSNARDLRGFKGDTYEGGIRVPFCMSWPGVIEAGSRYELPVSALDIVPTILAPCGVTEAKPGLSFDGVDLVPYLSGKNGGARPHRTLYYRRDNDFGIRHDDWMLTWNDKCGPSTIMLFDMGKDPGQRRDLVKENPELAQQLLDRFDAWDAELPDNRWWGGPWNRNRTGKQRSVAEFNASDRGDIRRKIKAGGPPAKH